jgi:hypothetical protein
VLKFNTAALMLAQRAPGETAFGLVRQPTSQPRDDHHFIGRETSSQPHTRRMQCRGPSPAWPGAVCASFVGYVKKRGGWPMSSLLDDQGTLHSLHYIAADGAKWFLPGGRVAGCFYQIGEPRGVICVGEGFATMATVHEVTGHAAVAAINKSSLLAVAQSFRSRFPAAKIVLCTDDDWKVPGNPGLTDARAAAAAVGGVVAVPEFSEGRGEKDTDFNDMARVAGNGAVLDRVEKALGGKPVDALDSQPNDKTAPESTKKPKAPRAPSEDDLALDFASRHKDELRFVSFWGKWLKWTGGKWQVEKTLAAFDLARRICHRHSLGGLRARTVAAIELMARSDRRHAATTDQWDADPWLFNTPAGTVELITGKLREHSSQDYITKNRRVQPWRRRLPHVL